MRLWNAHFWCFRFARPLSNHASRAIFFRGVMPLELKPPLAPMDALSVEAIPSGSDWQYEPKWDGFRCLVFRDRGRVELMSKSAKPLTRYRSEEHTSELHS